MKKYRTCPFCGSIYVCWNWIHVTKKKLQKLNPWKKIKGAPWGHECWDCERYNETSKKVTDGIPYNELKKDWKLKGKI